jgi:hypothetical protein
MSSLSGEHPSSVRWFVRSFVRSSFVRSSFVLSSFVRLFSFACFLAQYSRYRYSNSHRLTSLHHHHPPHIPVTAQPSANPDNSAFSLLDQLSCSPSLILTIQTICASSPSLSAHSLRFPRGPSCPASRSAAVLRYFSLQVAPTRSDFVKSTFAPPFLDRLHPLSA